MVRFLIDLAAIVFFAEQFNPSSSSDQIMETAIIEIRQFPALSQLSDRVKHI